MSVYEYKIRVLHIQKKYHHSKLGNLRSYFFSNSPVRWRFTNVVLPVTLSSQLIVKLQH